MSSALRIAVSEEKGNTAVTLLQITGDLDGKTYQDLETKATELLDAGSRNLLLDLSGVHFMGSAGLRALHGIAHKMKTGGKGGQLKLLNPSEPVSKVMKTLGFDKHFSIYTDLDTAVNAF